MTSIEWLIKEIEKHDKEFSSFYGAEITQAREMHKQEMIGAISAGYDYNDSGYVRWMGEEYYNETYGSKGSDDKKINLVEIPQEQLEKERNPNYKYFSIDEPKHENCCTPIGQIKRYVDCKGCDRKPKQEKPDFGVFDKEMAESITRTGQKLVRELQRVMEQETVEEAAKEYIIKKYQKGTYLGKLFIAGAKWQEERMHSEEEALTLLNEYNEYLFSFIDRDEVGIGTEKEDVKKWFEQFKKR